MSLEKATIRDFGGGWNVSDSDLNLNSRYQPISVNVVRGIDGSFSARQGMGLYSDFEDGDEVTVTGTFDMATVNLSPAITLTDTAHGRASGDHITISGVLTDVNGIPAASINGTHGILVIDPDTIKFYCDAAATSTATDSVASLTLTYDNHLIGGNIIHEQYFNRRLLVFTDMGEVGSVDDTGVCARLWGVSEAEALTSGLVPTRKCAHWSSTPFKSTVVACNGYDKDKPLQIADDFTVEFLVDKATFSNAAVPRADYVVSLLGYVVFIRTEYGDPFVESSARGTDGTFTREASPADAAEVDLSMVTETVETTLLGAAQIRDKLYVAFYDKGMIGTLGVYDGAYHVPDFGDTIAENGVVSHRTMVSLGNDIFMCDYAGVPSLSISQQSGIYVPVRLSELIAPAIQKHLSSLLEETLRTKAFAVFNRSDRSYMLFIPIYDETTRSLPTDSLLFNEDLRALNYAVVRAPGHRLFEKSQITVAGATDIGDLLAADINGVRTVVSIIDDDLFVIELGGAPSSDNVTFGGGAGMSFTPINDETLVYAFEYNKEFKIRRWTMYRGWNFDCAATSQRGKMFLAKGKKVYRMGDNELPVYADFVNDYDYRAWDNSFAYVVGDRVLDSSDGIVYVCLIEHTSAATGTFAEYRTDNQTVWEEYTGEPIEWEMETPWSDLKDRTRNKINKYVGLDSEGYDVFTVSAFTNKIRRDPSTNELIPKASLQFTAGDAGGWGTQNSGNFGGGRRTRDEKVWPFAVRGKLIRWRFNGATKKKVRIISHTMYYMMGNIR